MINVRYLLFVFYVYAHTQMCVHSPEKNFYETSDLLKFFSMYVDQHYSKDIAGRNLSKMSNRFSILSEFQVLDFAESTLFKF